MPRPARRDCRGIGLAQAGRFRFLETAERTGRDRQPRMARGGELHRGGEILCRGRDAESGFTGRRAVQHLGDDGATPFHRGRRSRGVRQNIDQEVGRQLQPPAERQGLAKRLPVHQQRQVDRKLQRRPGAEPSDMLDDRVPESFKTDLDVLSPTLGRGARGGAC